MNSSLPTALAAQAEEKAASLRRDKISSLWGFDQREACAEMERELVRQLGRGDSVRFFAAPSRVNLIGEHIDYNGGLVLPAALDRSILLAARRRDDDLVRLTNLDFAGEFEGRLGSLPSQPEPGAWWAYPIGVLAAILGKGFELKAGFEGLYWSNIPAGAGVSSSAAIEVVSGFALCALYELGLSAQEIALAGQSAENDYVGVSCGIMDQFAVALGRSGHALLLDCASREHSHVPLDLGEYCLVIANTNKKRRLADSKYNERRAECETALHALRAVRPKLQNLCSLSPADFKGLAGRIPSETARRRARHAVTEQERVRQAVLALSNGDITRLGELLKESHESLRCDYEVTGPELDAIVDLALSARGCLGARMTGAGFGGCSVNIVRRDAVANFEQQVGEAYRARAGLEADFYACNPSDGVREIIAG